MYIKIKLNGKIFSLTRHVYEFLYHTLFPLVTEMIVLYIFVSFVYLLIKGCRSKTANTYFNDTRDCMFTNTPVYKSK